MFLRLLCLSFFLVLFNAAAAQAFTLYVSNERSGDISVIDPSTQSVVRTLDAGKRPRGIHVGPITGQIYVALSGSPRLGPGADPERAKSGEADKSADGIGIFDPSSGRVLRMLRVGSDPGEFAIDNDENRVVVANEDIAQASVWSISSGQKIAEFAVSGEPEGVALAPTRDEVYITCEERGELFILDLRRHREIARLDIGGRPQAIAFHPTRPRAYIPSEGTASVAVIDTTVQRIMTKIPIAGDSVLPMDAVVSSDGRTLFVSTGRGNSIAIIDTSTNEVAAVVPVGERPWGIALSPDGRTLYSANGGSNDISVIDVNATREIGRIAVGDGPWGLAIGPALQPEGS